MASRSVLAIGIVVNTQEYAKSYAGNCINCTNCHLDGGLNPNTTSFVGLAAVYPEYRARNARVNTLADRVNECFERSLNGQALSADSSKLQAVVAYITWLSHGVLSGATIPWRASNALSHGYLSIPSMESACLRANALSVTASTARGR